MIRYAITRGQPEIPAGEVLAHIAALLAQEVDFVQIREKHLPARGLQELVRAALRLPNPKGTKILVNTALDVALAAGAHGLHLPSGAPAPRDLRPILPPGLVISVACHSESAVKGAEREGADYALLSPVFSPLSKPDTRPALGLARLREITATARIPILALGGISPENMRACIEAGAAGVAGITLFSG